MCISVVVLTVLYLKIALFLYQQKNSLHLASEMVRKRAKRNRKIITMLVIILILFYFVWISFYVLQFVSYVNPNVVIPRAPFYILLFLYPVANPIVYYVFNEKYRQGFKEILCYLCLCNKEIKDNVGNGGHVNQAVENLELQEQ